MPVLFISRRARLRQVVVLEAGGSRPLVHPNKICAFRFSTIRFDLLEWRSVIAPLAQLVEQRTLNPQVLGSNPRGGTICKFILA